MGLNRNINDDSTLAYLFNKTRQGASDALEKAVAYLKGLIDGKVSKSGDTMTGVLNVVLANPGIYQKTTEMDCSDSSYTSTTNSTGYRVQDKNGDDVAVFTDRYVSDGKTGVYISARKKVSGSMVNNNLQLLVDSSGNKSVVVTDSAAWRTGIGAVNKAGDTMTGDLVINKSAPVCDAKSSVADSTAASAESRIAFGQFRALDKNGLVTLYILSTIETDGRVQTTIRTRKRISGTDYSYGLVMAVNNDKTLTVTLDQVAAWRKALGLGDANGAFPLTIAQGGTGQTGTSSTSTASEIITAASGFTINAASYRQWGKLAMLRIEATKTTATSTAASMTIGTVVSGKRPPMETMVVPGTDSLAYSYLGSAGGIVAYGTWAANAKKTFWATYILA